MSADKCPHCRAGKSSDGNWFDCMTYEGQEQTNLCLERAAHAATKRELEQARAECGIAHDQRRDEAHRANNAEAALELSEMSVATLKNRAEAAEARVAELEGLRITGTHYFSDFVGVAVNLPLGSTPTIGGTLGQAMPGGGK